MSGKLSGKVAIVTGGSQGFGAGIVKKFVEEGARVVIVDINEQAGQRVAGENPGAIFLYGDVTCQADWEKALETAVTKFGKLDIVVNNAGILIVKVFLQGSAIRDEGLGHGRNQELRPRNVQCRSLPIIRKKNTSAFGALTSRASFTAPRSSSLIFRNKAAVSLSIRRVSAKRAHDRKESGTVPRRRRLVTYADRSDTQDSSNGFG